MTPLQSFVHEHLGAVTVLPAPAVRGATRLLRVRDGGGREWFAKRLLRPHLWRAESSAYDLWGHLPHVPELAARDERRSALLVAALGGHRPRDQHHAALRAAGAVLHELHATPPPDDWDSGWRDLVRRDVSRALAHIEEQGIVVDGGLVRRAAAELVTLDLPEVATHGDFQPHNWRLHQGALSVFDFASAGRRPAAWDLARLRHGACWDNPRAWEPLLAGYGRDLTDTEQRFVTCSLPWRAVVAIRYGLQHDRPALVASGTSRLDALAGGRTWGARPGYRRRLRVAALNRVPRQAVSRGR